MVSDARLKLFEGFGIEIEYMIVDRDSLNIMPIADKLLGNHNEVVVDELCYSNELALHLIELKTNGPVAKLSDLPEIVHKHIKGLNNKLIENNACLLPTALHPWMDVTEELKIWPHKYNDIYKAYDRIFNCRGHGWSNVQSVHLNLSFANDEEFSRLHTVIRLLLPIIPIITASSPIVELEPSGYTDTRLFYYNQNQRRVPIIAGQIIPEYFFSQQQYVAELLSKIYKAIAPYDKDKLLQYEWINSRGAIARFDRNTIEIRLIDTQESPLADLAIITLLVATLQHLVNETWSDYSEYMRFSTQRLKDIYLGAIKHGSNYVITDKRYLKAFAYHAKDKCTGNELWRNIFANIKRSQYGINKKFFPAIENILINGNLAERILTSLSENFTKKNIAKKYKKLATCLENNTIYLQT